jgi:hypothetical protein
MSIGAYSGLNLSAQNSGANFAPFPCDQSLTPTLFAVQKLSRSGSMYSPGTSTMNMNTSSSNSSSANMMKMMTQMMTLLLDDSDSGAKTTPLKEEIEVCDDSKGAWGDPHYETVGKDGKKIKFDHDGQTGHTYNVFSGDGYQVKGLYGKNGKAGNDIINTKIEAGKDTIEYSVDGKTKINGKVIKNGDVTLTDGTKVAVNGKNMTLVSKEGDSSIKFNNSDGISVDPKGKFSNLGGILGTAINTNKALTEKEANKFDLTTKAKKAA